ncbi:MAG: hypothetical protein LBQ33_00435 [Oscillospiraceae bacterium]|jgi:hypothetical protein|nr:hypothetical protein [Oscillospiraceae bacterium]
MKTLLVYHSRRPCVRTMCEASAKRDVDVLELRPYYRKRLFLGAVSSAYAALTGRGARIIPLEVDLSQYQSVILVTSLQLLAPSAECNEFLYRCDLSGREVTCVLCSSLRSFGSSAGAALRKRVRLAGGVCRDVMYLTESDLSRKAEEADVFALLQKAAG